MRLFTLAPMRTLIPLLAVALGACASAREAAPSGPVSAEPPASAPPEAAPPPEPALPEAPPGGVSPAEPAGVGEPARSVGDADCEGRKASIDARLTEASRCSTDADCTTLMPGCPFGCFRAIHRTTDKAAIEADIQAYNQTCAACAYRCRPLEHPPTCRAGRCSTE